MLFEVESFLVRGHERMPFFHDSFKKGRSLDLRHGLINHLLFCVRWLCDECYDIALLEPLKELFNEILRIPAHGLESLIGCFFPLAWGGLTLL